MDKVKRAMDKDLLLHALNQKEAAYRAYRPRTADMDISVIRKYCAGKPVACICMEIPCCESTVFRCVERFREFLEKRGPESLLERLRTYIAQNPPRFGVGDAQSVLELLYSFYGEYNRFESEAVKNGFEELYRQLEGLPLKEIDSVIYTVSGLCRQHERCWLYRGRKGRH